MANPDPRDLEIQRLRKENAILRATPLRTPGDVADLAQLLNLDLDSAGQIASVKHPDGRVFDWQSAQQAIAAGEFGTGPQALLSQPPEGISQLQQRDITIADLGKLDSEGLRRVMTGEISVSR